MICPNCKNEFFAETLCPICGLDERGALWKTAEEHLGQERYALAAEIYGKILIKNPGELEAAKKQAVAVSYLALASLEKTEVQKAESLLTNVLNSDWQWEIGHQFRVLIADKTDRLDLLVKEYKSFTEKGPADRVEMASRVIKMVQLTMRFKAEGAKAKRTLQDTLSWRNYLKAFWPLLVGIPILWLAVQGLLVVSEQKQPMGPFLGLTVLGFCVAFPPLLLTLRYLKLSPKSRKRVLPHEL